VKEQNMDRKVETALVKRALRQAGVPVRSVRHDTGTAWGWLAITLLPLVATHCRIDPEPYGPCGADCPACRENREREARALKITQTVTGRHGDYDGRISID